MLVVYVSVLRMHGHKNINFINAKQAKGIHLYNQKVLLRTGEFVARNM